MTTPPCAFAHRLFPDLPRRRPRHAAGPPAPVRRRTCRPRTASSSRRLGRDRRPVEEQDVPVANRSPRSAWTSAVGRWRPPGGPSLSIALTLGPLRRCMPMRNRKIPPFPFGLLDVGVLNVSTVDTGPQGSCGTVRRPPQVRTPLALSMALTRGREIRVPTSTLALTFSEPPLLHEGRDLLAKGWAHCTKAPPARSTPDPLPVAPNPRAVPPGHSSTAHSKEDHNPNH